MNESLEKAIHDLGFASDDLRAALNKGNSVEFLLVLPLIKKVNETKLEVEALLNARMSDAK